VIVLSFVDQKKRREATPAFPHLSPSAFLPSFVDNKTRELAPLFLLFSFFFLLFFSGLLGAGRSAMDVNALRDRIQSTLDANADNRRQAELDLKYVWLTKCCLLILWFANVFLSNY
jgi:hypothetical protein